MLAIIHESSETFMNGLQIFMNEDFQFKTEISISHIMNEDFFQTFVGMFMGTFINVHLLQTPSGFSVGAKSRRASKTVRSWNEKSEPNFLRNTRRMTYMIFLRGLFPKALTSVNKKNTLGR